MRLSRIFAVLVVVALVAGALAMAQAPAKAPKPGAEHMRLGVYVGKWTGSGEMKPSPMGPGGKVTWTETCEWFGGNFAVVCHSDGTGPMGPSKGLGIMSYSMEEKHYVYFGITSVGEVEQSTGTVQGKVWNWTGEGKMQGKPYKGRYTSTEQADGSHTFKFEMSQDAGKTWSVVMEGKSTRVK